MEVNELSSQVKYGIIKHEQMFGFYSRSKGGLSKKCRRKISLRGIVAVFATKRWSMADFVYG